MLFLSVISIEIMYIWIYLLATQAACVVKVNMYHKSICIVSLNQNQQQYFKYRYEKWLVLILELMKKGKKKQTFWSTGSPSIIFVSFEPKSNFTLACSSVHYETLPLLNDSLLLNATLKCTVGSWPGERKYQLIWECVVFFPLSCFASTWTTTRVAERKSKLATDLAVK